LPKDPIAKHALVISPTKVTRFTYAVPAVETEDYGINARPKKKETKKKIERRNEKIRCNLLLIQAKAAAP
jgi:hypothetical protein